MDMETTAKLRTGHNKSYLTAQPSDNKTLESYTNRDTSFERDRSLENIDLAKQLSQ